MAYRTRNNGRKTRRGTRHGGRTRRYRRGGGSKINDSE